MRHRRAPRGIAAALGALVDRVEPLTPLGRVQRAWPGAVGELIATHATPTAVADGAVVVTCDAAVWAQELDLLQADVVERLAAAVPGVRVDALRCRAAPSGSWARSGSRSGSR
jgi:predicted nucleic acid-binding Zn ribbon protein